MSKINVLLETFKTTLDAFSEEAKLIIGGACALKLHGLNLGREIDDLDIIIYNPSKDVLKILKVLNVIDPVKNKDIEYDSKKPFVEKRRSTKITSGQLTLNILIEEGKEFPKDLLTYRDFPVQSIENVIDAKSSYHRDFGSYRRAKDMFDFQNLKNLNFNFKQIFPNK